MSEVRREHPAAAALRQHWPEYLMEAAGLGIFMLMTCLIVIGAEHPASPVRQAIGDGLPRRIPIGLAIATTAVALIYSPLGQRSGAHFNPAVTLAFCRLGKVAPWDALFYVLAQFVGGFAGVQLAAAALGASLADPAVNYAVTGPGPAGAAVAFGAELAISFGLMSLVLRVSNTPHLARWTGLFSAALVATYIVFEAPLSGMSMNPARTLASALGAGQWTALWVYFTAPPLGMLLAAEVYARLAGTQRVGCAKLNHANDQRCIFRCAYRAADATAPRLAAKAS